MSDIVSQALSHPPVDTRYVADRWHPARISPKGVWIEARVLASSVIKPANRSAHKFLILCRARSGSTLLTQLLNAHEDVACGREVMARRVLFPRSYLNRLARKSVTPAYGAKLLSYQMVQVQRLADPAGFLRDLAVDGFRFIHVERDSFSQTLSLRMAQQSRVFHQSTRTDVGKKSWQRGSDSATHAPVEIDIEDFARRLEWSRMLMDYERHCLRDLPHLKISYETDLQSQEAQQATANRIFDFIGVPQASVSGGVKKLLPTDPRAVIANYDTLAQHLRDKGLADLLPD